MRQFLFVGGLLVVALAVAFVIMGGSRGLRPTGTLLGMPQVSRDAKPLSEFRRILSIVLTGRPIAAEDFDDWVSLLDRAEVRAWVVSRYSSASENEQAQLIQCVQRRAERAQYGDMVEFIEARVREESFGRSGAVLAMAHYDTPNRRALLKAFIDDKADGFRYHGLYIGLRVYLGLYGVEGIEDRLRSLMEDGRHSHRSVTAAVVAAYAHDEAWRETANRRLDAEVTGGITYQLAAAILRVFNEAGTCAAFPLVERGGLTFEGEPAQVELGRYKARCP